MSSIRHILVDEFRRICQTQEFADVHFLLDQGDYYVLLSYESDVEFGDQIPFGFIYKNKFLESRQELKKLFDKKMDSSKISRQEIASDISSISRKMDALYNKGMFTDVEDILHEWSGSTEDGERENSPYVTLSVLGIRVLGIDYLGEHDPLIDVGETDTARILNKLPISTEITKISEQGWFQKLNDDSRQLVRAGEYFIEKAYSQEERDLLIDYSPLLLDFVKAVEKEIREHIHLNLPSLVQISEMMCRKIDPNGGSSRKRNELNALAKVAAGIKEFKGEYNPSGTKVIYFLFKYYALGIELEFIPEFKGYLNESKKRILAKERHVIDRLGQIGNDRNKLVHERIIESDNEFLMHYDGLKLALKLLADIKN